MISGVPQELVSVTHSAEPGALAHRDVSDATREALRSADGLGPEQDRTDNISDMAWKAFCEHYNDSTITRDAIFDYIYGVLHAPAYRDRFANNLSKELPRIPFARDFRAFAEAGRRLADLHMGYETGREYPLELRSDHPGELRPEHLRIGRKKMKWAYMGSSIPAQLDYCQ